MTDDFKNGFQDGYKKGAQDGMRQFALILTTSIGKLAKDNVDEIVKNMIHQMQKMQEKMSDLPRSSAFDELKNKEMFQ